MYFYPSPGEGTSSEIPGHLWASSVLTHLFPEKKQHKKKVKKKVKKKKVTHMHNTMTTTYPEATRVIPKYHHGITRIPPGSSPGTTRVPYGVPPEYHPWRLRGSAVVPTRDVGDSQP
jgi:hypothetical protein